MRPVMPGFLRHPAAARLLLAAGLVVTASRVVAPETFPLRSGTLSIRIAPALPGGGVILDLGPFGTLSWRTHRGPLNVEASFEIGSDAGDLPALGDLRDLRLSYVLRKTPWLLAFGALLGALVVQGSPRRRALEAGLTAGGTVLAAVLVVGVSALTFDPAAMNDPRYRGPVKDAPRVVSLLKEIRGDWAGVRRNINKVVEGLQRIHAQIVASGSAPESPTVKLLVVSDLHNNPLGLVIADELRRRFGVAGVLDGGDFTDRGTDIEGEIFSRFASLGIPHVISPGNHEDVAALTRVRRIPKLAILDGEGADTATIEGLTILGDADPNAHSIEIDPRNEVASQQMPALCERLARRFAEVRPAVVLVHDRAMGECAETLAKQQTAPLVLVWGHAHRQSYEASGSVVSLSPGTSGANGIKSPKSSPYGFALLEFDSQTSRLASVCLFQFDAPQRLRQVACHLSPAQT